MKTFYYLVSGLTTGDYFGKTEGETESETLAQLESTYGVDTHAPISVKIIDEDTYKKAQKAEVEAEV